MIPVHPKARYGRATQSTLTNCHKGEFGVTGGSTVSRVLFLILLSVFVFTVTQAQVPEAVDSVNRAWTAAGRAILMAL